ncbi:MAG TPA: DUF1028 domain-containing protein [Candidatus Acidoferrales bacterium]|nr:DUF1028 domain-containing protein [Candidatus Acidoferrales bacterium]
MKGAGLILLGILSLSVSSWAQEAHLAGRAPQRPLRPVHTFSIVARDPATGEMGVAVQSHWFAVGAEVTWAEAGVGVVATQSFIDPGYGQLGLDLMRAGKSAPEALRGLLAADESRDTRQVAMIDAQGRVAAHTGAKCIQAAGHHVGSNYSTEANLMEKSTVWPAMAKAFENATGDLTDRLLIALEAAQAEGGDIRGKQSAAILVVRGKSTGRPWADKVVDLRVDDSDDPINELKRLVRYHRAYDHMERGDACSTIRDWSCAVHEYGEAEKLLPEQMEVIFWHAVTLVTSGHTEDSLPLFKKVFAREPKWAELLGRLPDADLFPKDPKLIARIKAQMPAH